MKPRRTHFRSLLALLLWSATSAAVFAHGGEAAHRDADATGPRDWHELWRAWALEPVVVVSLVLTAWVYARGVGRLWSAAGWGRGVRAWEAWCFAGGWLTLVVALVSPL